MSHGQARAEGLTKRRLGNLVRHGVVERVTVGVYDCLISFPDDHPADIERRRSAWTALLACEPEGVAVGACALVLHGVWGLPRRIQPEAALPKGRFGRGPSGVRTRRFAKPMSTIPFNGRQIVDPVTALVQALPELDRDVGIAVLDSALNRRLITDADIATIRNGARGRRGAARLHQWWSLVDGRAESPIETRARLKCHDAGLPPPDLQVEIRDSGGRFVARGDLGWQRDDGSWVLVEMDGQEVHDTPEAVFADRTRQNDLAIAGRHTVLRFTGRDLDGGLIPSTVRAAL